MIGGEPVAVFGELHPEVITNFGLDHPAAAVEIDVTALVRIIWSE